MKKRIFAAAVMILMISFSACSKQENQQSNIAKEDEKYSEILTYLNDSSYTDITQISRARIISTNPTDTALAGSAVTYYAEISGKTAEGENITQRFNQVNVSEAANESDYTFLRSNTIAIYDDGSQKNISLTVTFGPLTESFTYNVVKQEVSENNYALLVNTFTGVGETFEPSDLVVSDWIYYTNGRSNTVSQLRSEANAALEQMFTAAENDGIELWACSGYRPYDMQQKLYDAAVASLGEDQNDTAKPGYSEHQTGLTMDITWASASGGLYQSMEYDEEYAWLTENSYKYGWVLRYPKDSEDITLYMFEPWHYRYIGVEMATAYHESGMSTLDEFLSVVR